MAHLLVLGILCLKLTAILAGTCKSGRLSNSLSLLRYTTCATYVIIHTLAVRTDR